MSSSPQNGWLGSVLLWKAARYWREPPAYIFICSVVLCGPPPEAVHMQQQSSPVSTPLLNKMTRGGRRPSTSTLSPEEQAELKKARNTASKRASRARQAAETRARRRAHGGIFLSVTGATPPPPPPPPPQDPSPNLPLLLMAPPFPAWTTTWTSLALSAENSIALSSGAATRTWRKPGGRIFYGHHLRLLEGLCEPRRSPSLWAAVDLRFLGPV